MLNDKMIAKIASYFNIPDINKKWFDINLSLEDESELMTLLDSNDSDADIERISEILQRYPPLKPYIEQQNLKVDYIKESLKSCDSSSVLHIKDMLDESVIHHFKNTGIKHILSESLNSKNVDKFVKEKMVEMISPLNSPYISLLESDCVSFEERPMKKLFEDMEPIKPIGSKPPLGTIEEEKAKKQEQEAISALSTMSTEEIEKRADLANGVNTGEAENSQENREISTNDEIQRMSRDELEAEIEKMKNLINA